MAKIAQEFYCNDCSGFIRVKLNLALNHRITVQCPKCSHQHPRVIVDGIIYETHPEVVSSYTEEICPPMSSYSKESILASPHSRDGVTLTEAVIDPAVRARWFERFGLRV